MATDERIQAVYEAASESICDFGIRLAQNYARGDVSPAEAKFAVGNAMLVNGIVAIAFNLEDDELTALCNDIQAVVAGCVAECVERAAA